MLNPIEYLIENISWYEPIYNIAWILFILYALVLPPLALVLFHKNRQLNRILPPMAWEHHRKTYSHLLGAALVIFSFRLIPY